MIRRLIISIMMNLGCSSQNSDSTEIKYFQSWGSYKIPKIPQLEIDYDSLDKYETYYKAYYVNSQIVKFEKYVNGEIKGFDEYEYWEESGKLKKHILVNHLGEKRIHHYNKRGKKIED